jgi:hypothetical protein
MRRVKASTRLREFDEPLADDSDISSADLDITGPVQYLLGL